MTDKYAKLRKDVPQAIEEAKAEGGINYRAQMIADLLADYDWLRQIVEMAAAGNTEYAVLQQQAQTALAQE